MFNGVPLAPKPLWLICFAGWRSDTCFKRFISFSLCCHLALLRWRCLTICYWFGIFAFALDPAKKYFLYLLLAKRTYHMIFDLLNLRQRHQLNDILVDFASAYYGHWPFAIRNQVTSNDCRCFWCLSWACYWHRLSLRGYVFFSWDARLRCTSLLIAYPGPTSHSEKKNVTDSHTLGWFQFGNAGRVELWERSVARSFRRSFQFL